VRARLGPLLTPIDVAPGHGSLISAAAVAELDWPGHQVPRSGLGPVRLNPGVSASGLPLTLSGLGLHEFGVDQLNAAERGVRERMSERVGQLMLGFGGDSILGSWQQLSGTWAFVPNTSIAGHTGGDLSVLVALQDLLTDPGRYDPALEAYLPHLLAETFGISVRILSHDPHRPDLDHEQLIHPVTGPAQRLLTLIHTLNPHHYHPTGRIEDWDR
jgi:hypothetical protein